MRIREALSQLAVMRVQPAHASNAQPVPASVVDCTARVVSYRPNSQQPQRCGGGG